MPNQFSRRAAMFGAAVVPLLRVAEGQGGPRDIVVSSANINNGGVNCCAKALQMIQSGADTLDAVIAGVNIVELDPRDSSVGYGGLPNEDGVVELDASCIHGPSRRGGAVGALRNIKTPSRVAQKILTETDHMMLAGEGALRFAKAMGFKEEDLLTEEARIQWMVWKRSLRDPKGHTNWESQTDAPAAPQKKARAVDELKEIFPQADEALLAQALENAAHPPHGTINCIALNRKGEMSAVTTTSGMAWKIPGRLGDSPIIGGGLWLDQDIGGAGSTGRGEENLRVCGAHTVVENMRHGMSPKEAALDALKRVARNFENDEKRLAAIDLQFYALRKDGEYAGATLWGGRGMRPRFVVASGPGESREENAVYLLERK
jgi:N4-(beta-N-acetylglucosaminyl)-L-asparaginase